jgi:hypothetical protein
MARPHHLDAHFARALHHRVKVIHLEPQQHPITVRFVGTIPDGAVMMFDFKAVQLQDEPAILHQLLILLAAVPTVAAQQALIPQAAGLYIRDTNQWLRAHGTYLGGTSALRSRREDTSEVVNEAVEISEAVRGMPTSVALPLLLLLLLLLRKFRHRLCAKRL